MEKIPVIIDCDPGHDDMMALVLAWGSGKLDIKAVTTVAGNNTIYNTTQNALNVMHYIGADEVPVAMGFQNPMVRSHAEQMEKMAANRRKMRPEPQEQGQKITGAAVHGKSGMDGFEFPAENPKTVADLRSVEMMAKILRESEEQVTIISMGPLTNLGFLIRLYPDVLPKIKRISMMGGTSEFILTRPFMEFNTYVDPEASKIVFESGLPITMFGYDVTYRVLFNQDTVDRLYAIGNNTGKMVADLLSFFRASHNKALTRLNLGDNAPIHDACAVAGVIDPTLVTDVRPMHVDIAVGGDLLDGATVCDYQGALEFLPKNVDVVYNMDTPRFLDMLVSAAAACN